VQTGKILVFNPDGTPASFSPIKILAGKDQAGTAVTDTLNGGAYGLSVDPSSGNILSIKSSSRIWKINYKTGQGIVRYNMPIPGYTSALSCPGADSYGEVFLAPVAPGYPLTILNPDFSNAGMVTNATQDYCRAVAASANGNDVYAAYFSQQKIMIFHSDNGSLGPYIKKDSIAGLTAESMVLNPKTGYLWTTSGNVTSGMPAAPYQGYRFYAINVATKKVVDSLAWYDPQIPTYGNDQRPRGIAFNKTGDTAYVAAFNSNSQPPSSWVEVFVTQPVSIPSAPTLVTPLNGASVVSSTPTLLWNTSANAASYRIQVATDSLFASLVLDDPTVTTTNRQVGPLSNNVKYYWRVSATNALGTSQYSVVWSFITAVPPPTVPTLASPANGATSVLIPPVLAWNPSTGATYYHLQVSIGPSFTTTVMDKDSLTLTSFRVTGLLNATMYYWRVLAWNVVGTSQYSTTWSFTTIVAPPLAPTLILPADGTAGISTSPTLTWNASTTAVSYRLQVAPNSTFSSTVVDQGGIVATGYFFNGLLNNTLYYWRVSAANAGGQSPYSNAWSFTTIIAAPSVPTLASPANNAMGNSINPTLTWNASSGAVSYRLQVSRNSTFSSPVVDQNALVGTSYTLSGLLNNTLYYWRVSATNVGGTSSYSTTWSFRTILAVTINPPTLSFGGVPLGANMQLPCVLTYSGQDTLHITNVVSLSSVFSTDLTQINLASSGQVTLNIRFTPTSTDQISSLIFVFHNLPTSPDTIHVSGVGLKVPVVQFSQKNISFGSVLIRRSRDTMITISNVGAQAFQISSAISSHAAFAVRPSSSVIAPGQSDHDTITFSPTSAGPVNALVLLFSNSLSSPDTIRVDGVGTTSTYASNENQIPSGYLLGQNYPNPFNPSTRIAFSIPKTTTVQLKVVDALGRDVATIANGERSAGVYEVIWDASSLPSGIYFYRLQAGEFVDTKKMIVLK
jgi:hypothetical protein